MVTFQFFRRAEDRGIEIKLDSARRRGEFALYLISSVLCNPRRLYQHLAQFRTISISEVESQSGQSVHKKKITVSGRLI